MKQNKKIFKVEVQIIDRGVTFPLSKPLEVHSPVYGNVKKKLNEWRHSMDLSTKFDFEILSTKLAGYGFI